MVIPELWPFSPARPLPNPKSTFLPSLIDMLNRGSPDFPTLPSLAAISHPTSWIIFFFFLSQVLCLLARFPASPSLSLPTCSFISNPLPLPRFQLCGRHKSEAEITKPVTSTSPGYLISLCLDFLIDRIQIIRVLVSYVCCEDQISSWT